MRAAHTAAGLQYTVVAASFWLSAAVSDVTLASAGDLDSTFGSGGNVVMLALGSGGANAVVIQADAKIVIAGGVSTCLSPPPIMGCSGNGVIIRYSSDGTLDPSFGTSGIFTGPAGSNFQTLFVQSDGKVIAAGGNAGNSTTNILLLRLNQDGSADNQFGSSGSVMIPGLTGQFFAAASLLQQGDGRLLLIGTRSTAAGVDVPIVLRLNADGSVDPSFGQGGLAMIVVPNIPVVDAHAAVLQADGKIVVTGSTEANSEAGVFGVFVARLNTDGTPDVTFGGGGVTVTSFTNAPQQYSNFGGGTAVWVLPVGKIMVAGMQNGEADPGGQFALLQFDSTGRVDSTFGTNGRQAFSAGGLLSYALAVWDGPQAVFAGTIPPPLPPGGGVEPDTTIVARFDPDGSPDTSFGTCGRVQFPRIPPAPDPLSNSAFNVRAIALQPDGKLVLSGGYVTVFPGGAGGSLIAVSRLLGGSSPAPFLTSSLNPAPTGQPVTLRAEISFGLLTPGSGTVTFNDGNTAIAGCDAVPLELHITTTTLVAYCSANNLGAGEHAISATYSGDTSNAPATSCVITQYIDPPGEITAAEYYEEVFDHYFLTTLPLEVAALDTDVFPGWRRTGQHFHVAPINELAGAAPVCRFFSGQTFAPQSTHFYTSLMSECAAVQRSSAWLFEGIVFGLGLSSAAGTCGPGTQPLYRLYNNGQGGAPNHRYLTDLTLRDTMIQSFGWIPEGAGIGVIGCVPNN